MKGFTVIQKLGGILFLFVVQISFSAALTDRFNGPFSPGDVFPSTLDCQNPLNPADLAFAQRSVIEFGLQADGNHLVLGLPNFLIALSKQELDSPSSISTAYSLDAKKYLLGYAISTADLGIGNESSPIFALGFHLRFLDFSSRQSGNISRWAYPDLGISGVYKQFHLDAAILNMATLSKSTDETLPLALPQEINIGLAYGPPNNWLVAAR